jgi:hypothetical protein
MTALRHGTELIAPGRFRKLRWLASFALRTLPSSPAWSITRTG